MIKARSREIAPNKKEIPGKLECVPWKAQLSIAQGGTANIDKKQQLKVWHVGRH